MGIVLTHGHEDHIGAVPYLWEKLRAPIYATPFTLELVRGKLIEAGLLGEVELHEIPMGGSFSLGPFNLSYIELAHSIAEGNALKIDTKHGTIFHTGDWKLDDTPVYGKAISTKGLKDIGNEGVLCMVGDSTNVFNKSASGSEQSVFDGLDEIMVSQKNRVVITTFASNVSRLDTIGKISIKHDRHLCLMGRSMHRIVSAAKKTGYLKDFPPILNEVDINNLPKNKVLILCTGCQGEERAALGRLARDDNKNFSLTEGDSVLFSSKMIPGNETSIARVMNELALANINIITEKDAHIHVSGHPGQPELKDMYEWIKPQNAIPVHGEARHLKKHKLFAEELGVANAVSPLNGDVIRIAPGRVQKVDEVPSGRLVLDGDCVLPIESDMIVERRRIMLHGHLSIVLLLDDEGAPLSLPVFIAKGIPGWEEKNNLFELILDKVEEVLGTLHSKNLLDDKLIEEEVRRKVRRLLKNEIGKKPITEVRVMHSDNDTKDLG